MAYSCRNDFLENGINPVHVEGRCDICLEDFYFETDEIPVVIRQCNHIFGHRCLRRHVETSKTCPMCRRDLWEGSDEEDSDDDYEEGEGENDGWLRLVDPEEDLMLM